MPTDPVCGEVFTEKEAEELGAEKIVRDGKTIWFCGPYCKKMYEADPEKYAAHAGASHRHG